jgi:type IV pilus assembly protein PilZ
MNAFFADYTKNISRGGTFIRTDKPLDIGTEVNHGMAKVVEN